MKILKSQIVKIKKGKKLKIINPVNIYGAKFGDNCFVGTNSSIIAPVHIGKNSYIAAGSVITKNVPNNHFSISRSKQKNIKNFKK